MTAQTPDGPVFGNLAGDPQNAIAHLLRMGEGEVPGALVHPDVPVPISLRHGHLPTTPNATDGAGVAKLEVKHPEALPDLQAFISQTTVAPTLSTSQKTQMRAPANARTAVLAMDYNGTPSAPWLLTAFDRRPSRALPQHDPRKYVGLLCPEEVAALPEVRALQDDLAQRFDTGPAAALWDEAQSGADVARGFFTNGSGQQQAINGLGRAVLEKGPGTQAMRSYAMTDLAEQARNAEGTLVPEQFNAWLSERPQALKGLLSGEQLDRVQGVLQDLGREALPDSAAPALSSEAAQKFASQGLLNRAFGEAAQSTRVQGLLGGPLGLLYGNANARIAGLLGDSLLDPELARRLMEQVAAGYRLPGQGLAAFASQGASRMLPLLPATMPDDELTAVP